LRWPAAAGDGVSSESRIPLSKRFKIGSAIALIIFGGIHLWNSTHALSLESRTLQFHLKQNFGQYQAEKTSGGQELHWIGRNAGFALTISQPVLEIPLQASHPDIERRPVKVQVFLVRDLFREKRQIGEITLRTNERGVYEFRVSESVNQEAILLLRVSRTWNPLKTTGVPDPRDLGVAVGTIRFKDRSTLGERPLSSLK